MFSANGAMMSTEIKFFFSVFSQVFPSRIPISDLEGTCDMGLRPFKEWHVYCIHYHPGNLGWLLNFEHSLSKNLQI